MSRGRIFNRRLNPVIINNSRKTSLSKLEGTKFILKSFWNCELFKSDVYGFKETVRTLKQGNCT